MIGSSRSQPVTATSSTPTTTPAEVHTSVSRCLPSATRVIERCARPARMSTIATIPLSTEATTETPSPTPTFSSSCGCRKRSTDVHRMTIAATKIISPSTAAEKYSALLCPNWWSSSAGCAATRSATSATKAATRLTTDSAASESRPTEPVMRYAANLSVMVATAAATDSQAYRVRFARDPGCRPASGGICAAGGVASNGIPAILAPVLRIR